MTTLLIILVALTMLCIGVAIYMLIEFIKSTRDLDEPEDITESEDYAQWSKDNTNDED